MNYEIHFASEFKEMQNEFIPNRVSVDAASSQNYYSIAAVSSY